MAVLVRIPTQFCFKTKGFLVLSPSILSSFLGLPLLFLVTISLSLNYVCRLVCDSIALIICTDVGVIGENMFLFLILLDG